MIAAHPSVGVRVAGLPLPAAALRSLTAVTVMQRLSQPTLCELVFSDPPGPLDAVATTPPGSSLEVSLAGNESELFAGEVTGSEFHQDAAGERTLRLRAYDRLHRLRLQHHVRTFAQMNPVDISRELLDPLGIQVIASANGPLREHILQYRQSDLELLTTLLDESGLYLRLEGSRAEIFGAAGSGPALPLAPGQNLLDVQVAVSSETAYSSVDARAWHPLTVRSLASRVSDADTGRTSAVDIGVSAVGGGEARLLTGGEAQSEAQLEATARAVLSQQQTQAVTFTGLAEGDQRLRPGASVALAGLTPELNGNYMLHAVDHLIDQHRGYLCELSSAPAPPREAQRGCQATLGLVTAVSDPEGRGRVKVALPALGEIESGWLQVLSAGAGAGKGLTMLPGVDDTVLVLFPLADPSQAIVLGGLYGEPGAADPGVASGQVRRYSFMSPAGQRVVLDDEAGTLSLDDGRGSRLELSPQRVRLTSATELELEAVAGVRIKGRTVDFERA